MKKHNQWIGKEDEKVELVYEAESSGSCAISSTDNMSVKLSLSEFDQPDKTDYLVAAACGVLTGILDSLWVGKFSLRDAQEWGRTNINGFVIKVAQSRGYKKDSLEGAIKYLEDKAPMVTDSLTNEWGGGYYHHFRDFSHHASIIGLVFSLITQFTGISYGTDVDGNFRGIEVKNTELIGETFEDKLYKGIVMWALHLVSDMAGSQNNPGAGTGIPGPILSLLKGLSTFPCIKAIKINYKDKEIGVSTMLSKIFHGTIFEHTSTKDLIHFDLRTELGIYAFDVKQKVPVVLNQCAIRAFYFLRRFVMELDYIHYKSIEDIKNINAHHILPYKNKCITRMSTISSGVFCAVDAGDAAIRTLLSKPDTKRELMTGVLLKINFSGLCNFAIAIKNDILFNVKGQTTPKDKLNETIGGAGSEVAASYDLTIDVSAQIDNTDLYRFAFRQMYNTVKENKERLFTAFSHLKEIQRRILLLEDDETETYSSVANCSYNSLMIETEKLVMRLFTLYGVDYHPFTEKEIYGYMPFYRIVDGKKIAYLFTESITERIQWEGIIKKYYVDKIIIVALVELGPDSQTRNQIVGYEMKLAKGKVEYITLKDLFALISETEYDIYMTYVEQYNSDIRKLIGYRTIVTPSDSSLIDMKKQLEAYLRSVNFDKILSNEGLYAHQIKKINNNFWNERRFRVLLGKASFAESFISSEWYYQSHRANSVLEQTAIIAGYLKSVEQLLFTIIQFSINTGKSMRRLGGEKNDFVEYTTKNVPIVDTTLGSLIGYSRHYIDLWDVNNYAKNYIVNKLSEFREKYRNDHFHKDNIYSVDEIEAIRNNTIFLHYLILGAMKISDSDFSTIDYVKDETVTKVKYELSYFRFEQWLDQILSGDNLLPSTSNINFSTQVYGSEGKKWLIMFTTYEKLDEKGLPQVNGIHYPYIGDDFSWDYTPDPAEDRNELFKRITNQVKLIIMEYINKGKYSDKLKSFSSVSASWVGGRYFESLYVRK